MFGITPLSAATSQPFSSLWPTEVAELMDELAGKTWVADTKQGSDEVRIEETIEWSRDRSFLHSTVVTSINGKEVGTSMGVMVWHPLRQRLLMWEFRHDGSFSRGVQSLTEDKERLEFDIESVDQSQSGWASTSTTVRRDPPQVTSVVTPVPVGGGLTGLSFPVVYSPKPGAPAG